MSSTDTSTNRAALEAVTKLFYQHVKIAEGFVAAQFPPGEVPPYAAAFPRWYALEFRGNPVLGWKYWAGEITAAQFKAQTDVRNLTQQTGPKPGESIFSEPVNFITRFLD